MNEYILSECLDDVVETGKSASTSVNILTPYIMTLTNCYLHTALEDLIGRNLILVGHINGSHNTGSHHGST